MSAAPIGSGTRPSSTTERSALRWTLAIIGYFMLYAALRILIGPPFFWDEAEAFYHSRQLAAGYGPQPPLYNWLQWVTFQVFGERFVAVVILRTGLWCAALVALFRLLSREAGPQAAGTSVLALSLVPVLSWESQKAYTHSLMAFFIAVLTTGAILRALRRGTWGDHMRLGLLLGLGVLSKLNFVLWPLGLLTGAALLRDWRSGLQPLRLLMAAAVAGVVAAPYAHWVWRHPELAGGRLNLLEISDGGGAGAWLAGTGAVLSAAAAFWGLALLVLGGFAARTRPSEQRSEGRDLVRLLLIGTAAMLSLIWLGVLVSGTTSMRERWFLPVGWGFVVALVLSLWPRLGPERRRGLAGVTAGLWALVLLAVPYLALVDPGERRAEYHVLADRLRAMGSPGVVTYALVPTIVGNLALLAPDLEAELLGPEPPTGEFLLVVVEGEEVARSHPDLANRADGGSQLTLTRRTEPLRLRIFRVKGI